jgi:chemotaxis protein MotB
MTTVSIKSSAAVLPLFVVVAIAVAGWVSYFFAQQEATQLGQQTEILSSRLEAQEKQEQAKKALSPAPTKPSVKIEPAPKPPKAEAPPPKKYNRLLLAEREKALRERDQARAEKIHTPAPTKPSVKTEPAPKPAPATASAKPPKAEAPPPEKYNRLLLAEREKALRERDQARPEKTHTPAPTKPSVKTEPAPKPAPATASPKPPKAEAPPPKKYNRLLLAEREKALQEKDEVQARIGTILKEKKNALEEGQRLRQQLIMSAENVERLKQKIEEVSSDIQKVKQQQQDRFFVLRQQFEQELEEKQITISQLKNHMTVVKVTAGILFASGSATLKPRGQEVLDLIADSLNSNPDRLISIEGHTDNLQLTQQSPYPSNWELSSARAASAARYLEKKTGVTAGRMQVVGHGEHQPIASNDTNAGRAANRRIEIILLPTSNLLPKKP